VVARRELQLRGQLMVLLLLRHDSSRSLHRTRTVDRFRPRKESS
jgi:hypothetical protein